MTMTFSFYDFENCLLSPLMYGAIRLNTFLRVQEASEVFNRYIIGVWSDNFTAAFFVSVIVTVFVPHIEETQNKVICLCIRRTCSVNVNVTSTCGANLYDISRRKPSRRPPI